MLRSPRLSMSRHVAPKNYKQFQPLSNSVGGSTQHGRDMERLKRWLRLRVQPVMRGLDPRIHLLRKKVLTKMDGLQDQARQ
jgi:hypothetical protein